MNFGQALDAARDGHCIRRHGWNNPERTVALRKLLEAKDCAVRARIYRDISAPAPETQGAGMMAPDYSKPSDRPPPVSEQDKASFDAHYLATFDESPGGARDFHEWATAHGFTEWQPTASGPLIETRNGPVLARPGDWIIKGVSGDFYPCSADVFAATYERV